MTLGREDERRVVSQEWRILSKGANVNECATSIEMLKTYFVKRQVEVLERLARHERGHLVLELTSVEIKNRREPALDPGAVVDVVQDLLRDREVIVVLRSLK